MPASLFLLELEGTMAAKGKSAKVAKDGKAAAAVDGLDRAAVAAVINDWCVDIGISANGREVSILVDRICGLSAGQSVESITSAPVPE